MRLTQLEQTKSELKRAIQGLIQFFVIFIIKSSSRDLFAFLRDCQVIILPHRWTVGRLIQSTWSLLQKQMDEGVWAFVDHWIDSLQCRLDRSLGRWIRDRRQRFYDSRSNFPRQIESDRPRPWPNRYATNPITVVRSKINARY